MVDSAALKQAIDWFTPEKLIRLISDDAWRIQQLMDAARRWDSLTETCACCGGSGVHEQTPWKSNPCSECENRGWKPAEWAVRVMASAMMESMGRTVVMPLPEAEAALVALVEGLEE